MDRHSNLQPAPPSSAGSGFPRIRLLWILIPLLGAFAVWASLGVYGLAFQQYTNTLAGTYSDFSQSWVGARIALFEHGDPYSPAALPRIQTLYYGHVLAADDPHRPTNPQAFFYPLYLVWLIWPFALLPFPLASILFKIAAAGLLIGGSYLYCGLLKWPGQRAARLALAAGILLTPAGLEAVQADQVTVIVYGLLLAVPACLARGRPGWAGILLALTWIKPQLAFPLTLGLLVWSVARPTFRSVFVPAAVTGLALLVASELLLPGWWRGWLGVLGVYGAATTGLRGFSDYRLIEWAGLALRGGLLLGSLALWLRVRSLPIVARPTVFTLTATLVVTMVIQQPWFTYNEVLLYPAILLLLSALRGAPVSAAPPRILGWLALAVFAAPWLIYPALYGTYVFHLIPAEGVNWPSFAALFLLADRVLNNFALLTLLLAYLSWALSLLASGAAGLTAPPHPDRAPVAKPGAT